MRFLKTNVATRITVGPFLDKTDGITPEIALTVTACLLTLMVDDAGVPTLVIDAAPTASGGDNDMVHVTSDAAGFYDLELTAAQLNYVGRAMLAITDVATHCPVFHEFMILPALVYDSLVSGSDALQVDAIQIGGTVQTANDVGADVDAILVDTNELQTDDIPTLIGAPAADLSADIAAVKVDTAATLADTGTDGVKVAAGAIVAASFGAGALDAAALATDAAQEIADALLATVAETAGSYTVQQILSILLAVLAGVTASSGATVKTPDGSATRVAATINASSERTAMTLTPSA